MVLQVSSFLITLWQTVSKAFESPDKSFILISRAQEELNIINILKSEGNSLQV